VGRPCARGLFLGVEKLVSMIGYPVSECAHWAVGQALTERGERVFSSGRGFGVTVPGNETVASQAVQCLSQDLVADSADRGACGDDPAALRTVGQLVQDAGGVPAVLGSLDRARQLEEVAGFVIGLAFAGADPRFAIPSVPNTSHDRG
jgi:8-hydroxy-5-deazaflavin:NADPH oxidoreductase